MLSVLIANMHSREADRLTASCRRMAARYTDEEMVCTVCQNTAQVRTALKKEACWDLQCLDLELPEGLELARLARRASPDGLIVLVAPVELSPEVYLCPSILPGGLLLRPYTGEQAAQVMDAALSARMERRGGAECFLLQSRDGEERIPYGEIEYFEARDKKLVAVTGTAEYTFYDTISHLEEIVPDRFIRCHRSFIVRKDAVRKLQFSQNTLTLKSGELLPVSRSYKPRLKEAMK